MITFKNFQKMNDEEINAFIQKLIKTIKDEPGFGDINISIKNRKVCVIKPTITYNIGEGKVN